MGETVERSKSPTYSVRPFQSGDRSRFLSLYEDVWDTAKGREWFAWRFEDTPFADDVRMIVAEEGDRLVGAEPLLPFRLRVGDRVLETLQPADWMVHPDCRRRGHFTRMTSAVLERYVEHATLLFNFPNGQLLPGLQSFDWQVVGAVPTSYRLQRPRALRGGQRSGALYSATARLSGPVVRGYNRLRDRLRASPSDASVERFETVPVETVRDLYTSARPDRAHVPRDRAFLEWRFENPHWETATYVAYRNGSAAASATVATETVRGATVTRVLDVQPMIDPAGDRAAAFGTLLSAVLSDARDAALVTAPSECYPRVLRQHGFWRDDTLPLSAVSTATTLAVRPPSSSEPDAVQRHRAGDDAADRPGDGLDLTDPDEWLLTPADRDVA